MKAVTAGTFGPLHIGHIELLSTALELSDDLVIALTTDEFASRHRTREVPVFDDRLENLRNLVDDLNEYCASVSYIELGDPYGVSIENPDLEAIVVSEETEERVKDINVTRRERGFRPLVKIVVPLVRGEDGERISSTRIMRGEIDEEDVSV